MGHIGHEQFFGIELNLSAKTAADIRCDHLHAIFRHADGTGQQGA